MRRIRTRALPVATLLTLGACAPPAVVYRPAAEAVAMAHPPFVVELRSGASVAVRMAFLERDTLFGTSADAAVGTHVDVRIATADIVRITRAERGPNGIAGGMAGFAIGVLLVATLTLALVALSGT